MMMEKVPSRFESVPAFEFITPILAKGIGSFVVWLKIFPTMVFCPKVRTFSRIKIIDVSKILCII
jgi:hypothetical protein